MTGIRNTLEQLTFESNYHCILLEKPENIYQFF